MKSRDCLAVKLIVGMLLVLLAGPARTQVSTTTVQGTVYSANGQPASGTLLVSWDAFTTANNQAVAAGSTSVGIGADGYVSVNLAPNQGASPAGSYYTAVYQLNGGSVSKEYWTVPAAGTATIASVRSTLEPAMVAVQTVSKSYVDALVANLSPGSGDFLPLEGGTLTGPLLLGTDPVSNLQASTKHYVDQQVATALPVAGGSVSGTLTVGNQIEVMPRVDVRSSQLAGGADPTGTRDSLAAFQAAIAFAQASTQSSGDVTYPALYVPPGHYLLNGTLRLPSDMRMVGDDRANVILQETNATANLITIVSDTNGCSTYSCLGGLDNLTLVGSGKNTTGALLEIDAAQLVLRDLTLYNHGGRGIQMNGPSERISGYNLSLFEIRWPFVMGGDSNEDYFYNTHILGAGETADWSGSSSPFTNYCYSVNCVNGVYVAPGTSSAPTPIYPDPHGALHVDKSVNVTFIGGSIKSSTMLSSVRVWNGDMIKFQNIYQENSDWSSVPSINRGYILGGTAERTYLTGTLSGTGSSVAVNDSSWMPQWYGLPADAQQNGNWYPYVILPQDYDRTSTAASAYVSGLKKNQYEIVSVDGFASDGNAYFNTRNAGGSTAPAGTQWPAGSVIEQYVTGFGGAVQLEDVHLNMVQGPLSDSSYAVACNQQAWNNCGEIVAGFAPEAQNLSSNPALNQVEFITPLGDPHDPVFGAGVGFSLRSMDMFNDGNNPYVGQIAVHHRAQIEVYGGTQLETHQGVGALTGSSEQVSISDATGGGYVTVPLYSATGAYAAVQLVMPEADSIWDNYHGVSTKRAALFEPYQQYGSFMAGQQYQNLYCLFDSPAADGGQPTNRFCAGGGPNNASGYGAGYGGGIEYDSWSGSSWSQIFKAAGQNGSGSVSIGAPLTVSGTTTMSAALTVNGSATASTVKATGNAAVGGALTASVLNGAITVDGQTYTTLNAAWSAAVTAASNSGKNQTIWLGPGTYAVTQTMQEPTNGACVSVVGSAGTTTGANIASTATTLSVTNGLNGDVFYLGNTTLTEGCTFKDLKILAARNATHGFEFQWHRGLVMENVSVDDTTAEGLLLGEETTSSGHQASAMLRNVTVSYSSASFTPANRPQYGVHLQKTFMDSYLHTIFVRNALTAALYNEGTGNIGYGVHGFGYPYTCATTPCSNSASSSTAANASYASSYVIYDVGGAGSVWTDTYADSPAVSAFYIGANGVAIHGGHVQWPDLTSFSSANFATVSASVTNNMLIADVDCLGMSSSVNWINYGSTGGVPPTFASVHHLTGCGNYYQALEPGTTTGLSGGGASNNAPSTGQVATLWVAPKAAAGSNYSAYSAQLYSGYTTDIFEGHFAAASPFFNITYQGTIRTQGGIALSTVLNTGATLTLTTANKNVLANASSGAQTITLPSCYTAMADKIQPTGLELTIVKTDTSANAVTMQTVSSQTINYQGATATSLGITSAGKRTLVCGPDNNWYAY